LAFCQSLPRIDWKPYVANSFMPQFEIASGKATPEPAHLASVAAEPMGQGDKAPISAAAKAAIEATVIVQGGAINRSADPLAQTAYTATGTGFFIDDRHILTRAHLAEHIVFDGSVTTYDGQAHKVHLVKLDDVDDLAEYELDDKTSFGKYKPVHFGPPADVAKGTPAFSAAYRPETGKIEINQGVTDGIITQDGELAREQAVVEAYNKKIGADPVPGIHDQYHKAVDSLDAETKKDALADLNGRFISASLSLEGGASGAGLFDLAGNVRGMDKLAGYTYTPELADQTRDLFTTLPTITAFLAAKNSKFTFSYLTMQGHTMQSIERADHSKRPPFNALDDVKAKMP
jgi:S1-C subfamily serine protease